LPAGNVEGLVGKAAVTIDALGFRGGCVAIRAVRSTSEGLCSKKLAWTSSTG
jgi:hypothetical protein